MDLLSNTIIFGVHGQHHFLGCFIKDLQHFCWGLRQKVGKDMFLGCQVLVVHHQTLSVLLRKRWGELYFQPAHSSRSLQKIARTDKPVSCRLQFADVCTFPEKCLEVNSLKMGGKLFLIYFSDKFFISTKLVIVPLQFSTDTSQAQCS